MARKFSDEELMDLIRQGKNQAECARILGVGEPAISKRLRRINVAVSKDIGLFSANRIVRTHMSTTVQTEAMQHQVRELLELINVVVNGEHLPEYWTAKQKISRLVSGKGSPASLLTALLAELRKLLEFDFNIQRELYSLKQVQNFQEVILEEIEKTDPETARRIKARLVEVHAVRSVLEYDDRASESRFAA